VLKEAPSPSSSTESGGAVREERVCRCAACGHQLALLRDRIDVEGAASRRFVNPEGVEYEIAGFRDAPGCSLIGERSAYWSWFAGYDWQVALCGRCGRHVGWSFTGAAARFFGLIVERIAL
jgi:hypothetical protein